MKVGSLVRRAGRAGPVGVLDRVLQPARLRAERRAAVSGPPASGPWRLLGEREPELRAIGAAVEGGEVGRAEELLLDWARRSALLLQPTAELARTLDVARERFPDAIGATLTAANRALAHRFTLFGWMEVDAGAEISWLRDPATGIVGALDFWADVDFEDEAAGNVRVLWELNRHQHLLDLARAFCLTGDRRYADEVERQTRSWISQNPWLLGANWASSLEVALRAIAWLWARSLLLAAGGLTARCNAEIVAALAQAGGHISRHLSYTYAPNTHLLGEALGLLYLGAMLPELRAARSWRALGRRLLAREADRQFLSDGFHYEHSTWYHRFSTDMYLHAALVCRQSGRPLPPEVLARLAQMLECLAATDGIAFGDEDGGRLLALSHTPPSDFRDTLALGAAMFSRADLKPDGPEPAEIVLWLLGPDGLAAYDDLGRDRGCTVGATPPRRASRCGRPVPSRALPGVGVVIMGTEGGPRLAFDCGDCRQDESAHDHADALSIQVTSDDGPMLIDPGAYTYVGAREWRQYFRGTGAHNTVVIDRRDQREADGLFGWHRTGGLRRRDWVMNPTFDLAEGEYTCRRTAHTRRVLYVKPGYWVICDLIAGGGEHDIEQWFHFPPCALALDAKGRCIADTPGGRLVLAPLPGTAAQIVNGRMEPIQGWFSDAFERKSAAPALCYHVRARLPAVMTTVIAPGATAEPEVAGFAKSDGSVAFTVEWPHTRDHILLARPDGRERAFGPYVSDARAAYVRENAAGEIISAFMCAGTLVGGRGRAPLLRGGEDVIRLARRSDSA